MCLYHIFIFLAATSIYSNSLTGDFVHDDVVAIVRNPDVNLAISAKEIDLSSFSNKGDNWDMWWSLWKNDYWGMPMSSLLSHKSYRPLTVLTFRLNYYLCDNSLCPEVFHGTNILIHGLVSILTLHLCRSVLKMRMRSAVLASLIFALHPVHTEAIAGITGRADALACLLMLISFLLYHKVLSISSSEKLSPSTRKIVRESEKCYCELNSVQKDFVKVTFTGNECNANTDCSTNILDLNDNEYLKCTLKTLPSLTFPLSKANAILVTSGFVGCAAMLAKESGITVLGINLLYDLYLHLHLFVLSSREKNTRENQADNNNTFMSNRLRKNLRSRLIFLSLLIFMSLSSRLALMDGEYPKFGCGDNPAACSSSKLTRMLTYAYLPIFNLFLLVYPRTLSYDWQMGSIPLLGTIWDTRNFATFCFYTTLFLLVQKTINSKKYKKGNAGTVLAVALLFIVIPYLPASNLLFSVGFVVAERVLYIPSLGFCILIVHGLDILYQTIKSQLNTRYLLQIFVKLLVWVCVCSLLLSFGLRTWQRNTVWQSRLTLFTSGLQDVPQNAKMHYNYANLQKEMGQSDKAIEHYSIAIKLWPEYASAHNNLGTLLMGHPASAEHHFLRAIQAGNQQHAGAHFNLGVLYMQNEKLFEAADHFKKSLTIDPSHRTAMEYLSNCYSMIHSLKMEKSIDENNILRNSTGSPINTTAANNIPEFSGNHSRSMIGNAVISQINKTDFQPNITRASRILVSYRNWTSITYIKQEKLKFDQGKVQFENKFYNLGKNY